MLKFIETINNLVKLITSLATLAVLGAVVFFGLKAYHTVAELTAKPIQMPTVKLPAVEMPPIKVALPEVKLPEVSLFGKKEEDDPDDVLKAWKKWGSMQYDPAAPRPGSPEYELANCTHEPKCDIFLRHYCLEHDGMRRP